MIFYFMIMLVEFKTNRRYVTSDLDIIHRYLEYFERRAAIISEEIAVNMQNIIEENQRWMREHGYS